PPISRWWAPPHRRAAAKGRRAAGGLANDGVGSPLVFPCIRGDAMTSAERFIPAADGAALRRERARAREIRQSGWWKRRIAEGRCHYCAREVGARALTLDHLVPLIRRGHPVEARVAPLCP